ncbi:hypothetical protein UCRPC4_g01302 [Phaeomoniella chlamydospora]|uniref:N-acetyltransferase domain-containing protein n=1 Tax=Phaeomoniella chlamydospora TaxID=158046 RepID=A0A0G2EWQ8_PHACM|nr:hypothetical protein UCRPC4_g01302 [Phaeomoniella chlamydospora]
MGQIHSLLSLARSTIHPLTQPKYFDEIQLPDSSSAELCLRHPEPEENVTLWKLTSDSWKDALTIPLYLEESPFLMTVPLAKDGGMAQWVLVDQNNAPNQRTLLASCESFRKRSLVSDPEGKVTEYITHGVASVYCNPEYRRRGYATRMMRELAKVFPDWQTDQNKCIASVLYSDIGKRFYTNVGWHPFPSYHLEFEKSLNDAGGSRDILVEDLVPLCADDEVMVWKAMACPSEDKRLRYTIIPDVEHMQWHHSKEEWVCKKLFGKQPLRKGAIAGRPGSRVWLIWTHRYYSPPCGPDSSENTLYILRAVIEDQTSLKLLACPSEVTNNDHQSRCEELVANIRAVLQAAQNEAAKWNLYHVKLWNPTPELKEAIQQTGIPHRGVKRDEEGISSLLWYGEGSGREEELAWVGNEKYAWC